ncbi:hypothetical protein [Hyalangium rubrum]|uniref:Uncharacterized protein n=1 Tax=Hyalangium rubrum TaxID=3103134 RepID=A0ABU5H0Z7_9BACT|nr:hypothetical protein [Hyalangium sp. s54d21]MDY7227120.1 hypothetical protein [Hyalangium sp. s54d21]
MIFDPAVFLLLLAAALIAFVSVYLLRRANAAQAAAWAAFARSHGMSMSPRGLRIEGTYEGLPLTVEARYVRAGRGTYVAAVLRLNVAALLPPEFSLEREGLGDKALRLVGKGDPEIGDARFDALFDLKSLSPATASVLRHKGVQEHLYELARAYTAFRIRDGWIEAEQRMVPSTEEELEAFTGPALMLALTLEQAQQERSLGSAPS